MTQVYHNPAVNIKDISSQKEIKNHVAYLVKNILFLQGRYRKFLEIGFIELTIEITNFKNLILKHKSEECPTKTDLTNWLNYPIYGARCAKNI